MTGFQIGGWEKEWNKADWKAWMEAEKPLSPRARISDDKESELDNHIMERYKRRIENNENCKRTEFE